VKYPNTIAYSLPYEIECRFFLKNPECSGQECPAQARNALLRPGMPVLSGREGRASFLAEHYVGSLARHPQAPLVGAGEACPTYESGVGAWMSDAHAAVERPKEQQHKRGTFLWRFAG